MALTMSDSFVGTVLGTDVDADVPILEIVARLEPLLPGESSKAR